MKVLDPGHCYELQVLHDGTSNEWHSGNHLMFVKRMGDNYPGNNSCYSGTTVQEVLRACCDRLRYVNAQGEKLAQKECPLSAEALGHLREAIRYLEVRAALRHGRDSSGITLDEAEFGHCCPKCNHVGCKGGCH